MVNHPESPQSQKCHCHHHGNHSSITLCFHSAGVNMLAGPVLFEDHDGGLKSLEFKIRRIRRNKDGE